MLIDSHCHLNFQVFEKNWQLRVKQAQQAGVKKIVVVGTNLETSQKAIEIATKTAGLYAAVGFHPHHCLNLLETTDKQIPIPEQIKNIKKQIKKLAESKKVIAIGECGLDYHLYKDSKYPANLLKISSDLKNLQKRILGEQIQLAKELNLPMIIHNREAHHDILDTIDHFCKIDGFYPQGVFHCVSGDKNYLRKVLAMGFYIGIDGNVTYNKQVESLAKAVPLERLLLETDSPYLTPEPIRSKMKHLNQRLRNEPVNVKIVAEFIAKTKSITIDQVCAQTTKNGETLFNI